MLPVVEGARTCWKLFGDVDQQIVDCCISPWESAEIAFDGFEKVCVVGCVIH
jgi:hypothetical protein